MKIRERENVSYFRKNLSLFYIIFYKGENFSENCAEIYWPVDTARHISHVTLDSCELIRFIASVMALFQLYRTVYFLQQFIANSPRQTFIERPDFSHLTNFQSTRYHPLLLILTRWLYKNTYDRIYNRASFSNFSLGPQNH